MKPLAAALRLLSVCFFLLFSISALAVDTDGDGVDDSIDAFPNDNCGSVDTDNDGKPDTLRLPCGTLIDGFESGILLLYLGAIHHRYGQLLAAVHTQVPRLQGRVQARLAIY